MSNDERTTRKASQYEKQIHAQLLNEKRTLGVPGARERRKKTDWVTKMATALSVVSWIVAFAVIIIIDQAQPEKQHFFNRFFNVGERDYWITSLLPVALGLLIGSLAICIFAFLFNMLRMKRKTDKYKKSIIVIGVIVVVSIVFFLLRFGAEILAI